MLKKYTSFKLQQGSSDIAHPDSYLIDWAGTRTPAYEVMKRFGNWKLKRHACFADAPVKREITPLREKFLVDFIN